jgi:N-ethylmaleimide reductase
MRADLLGEQSGDVMSAARAAYRGVLVGNMGYSPQEAADAIAAKKLDAVAFGTPFLANPDLPARAQAGAELNAPDPATFYTSGAKGYVDYPAMNAG